MSSHCDRNPKSVDARNHKYFPPASNTGYIASASPSVTCFVSPVSTFATSSRSEMKYTASPTRAGSSSQESVHGGETRSNALRSTIQIGRF